jgi:transcriptional regulator with XRE-family HTH domain
MKIKLHKASDIGPVVRAVRKAQRIRQDDMAGAIGVSENFLAKVEHGGGNAQWTKVFQVLEGLGIELVCDIPDDAENFLPGHKSGGS